MADSFTITSGKATIDKDPNATLDYVFDWTDWLDGVVDTIDSAVAEVSSDIADPATDAAILQTIIVGKTVVVWLSGGNVGEKLTLTCRITTNSTPARIDDRSVFIKIKER